MIKNYKPLLFLCICTLLMWQHTYAATISDFLDLSYTNPVTKRVMKYRLFVPKNYDKNKIYPMIGFLHGAGEGDANNIKQVTANNGCLHWADDSIQNKYPSFIVAPNINSNDGYWATAYWGNGNFKQDDFKISESLQNYINIIKDLKLKYSIDSNRVYSTGLSMGGGGTWASITRFPKMFAAAIPICGYGDPSKMTLIKDVPVWTFHGDADGIISVETTRGMVAALKAAGGTVKYTEIRNGGHGAWDYAYNTKGLGLADWLFAQKRKDVLTTNEGISATVEELLVYPNPSKGELNIILPSGNYREFSIFDITGRLVLTQTIKSNGIGEERVDLTGIQKGIYIVTTKGETTLRKMVILD